MRSHADTISETLSLRVAQVEAVAKLLDAGSTVPFIARYRKEATSSLDEVAIAAIRDQLLTLADLDRRRETILKSLRERDLLDAKLEQKVLAARTRVELEDLYLPHRPKRKTRASMARDRGLAPLAAALFAQDGRRIDARTFVSSSLGVANADDALAGARDIIAEQVNEHASARAELRTLFATKAQFTARVVKSKQEQASKFRDYFEWSEPLKRVPSHRLLAVLRGKNEGFLTISARPDERDGVGRLRRKFATGHGFARQQVELAVADVYKRLLLPSLEKETLAEAKVRADAQAIGVFATNLREILMAAPLGPQPVLAIDPGFRSGCKVAVLDKHGRLLDHATVFVHESGSRSDAAARTLKELCTRHKVGAVGIGNGTAGREAQAFVEALELGLPIIAVDESGASIYSAGDIARAEFPDLDLTVRGTVSIGRRLQDPLAELVKLDPKSIGVGQYQHDVDARALAESLSDTVESCVNAVGVDLNAASAQLLAHVAGLGPKLAEAIVRHRSDSGPFRNRKALLKVPRLGAKAFEQAAGFLRIVDSRDVLDASAVHPERYELVERIAKDQGCSVTELLNDATKRDRVDLERYVTAQVGRPTLEDILTELGKPGRDPRGAFEVFSFADVHRIEDLVLGAVLPGLVTNVTNFGAFVDVGVHNDGLVHVSQLADHFVRDPNDVVKVRQHVTVTVTSIDLPRKRIGLSMRSDAQAPS